MDNGRWVNGMGWHSQYMSKYTSVFSVHVCLSVCLCMCVYEGYPWSKRNVKCFVLVKDNGLSDGYVFQSSVHKYKKRARARHRRQKRAEDGQWEMQEGRGL